MNAVRTIAFSARFRALLSLGMVLGLGAVGTLAAWSTSTTSTSGVISTATIDITLDGSQGNPTPYTLVLPSSSALLPGQSSAVMLTVQNTGSKAFTYTSSAATNDPLGQALQLTVKTGATVSGGTCFNGTALTGTPGSPGSPAMPLSFGGVRGNVAASNGVDPLCVQLTLPATAPNSVQSLTGIVVLTFLATSV